MRNHAAANLVCVMLALICRWRQLRRRWTFPTEGSVSVRPVTGLSVTIDAQARDESMSTRKLILAMSKHALPQSVAGKACDCTVALTHADALPRRSATGAEQQPRPELDALGDDCRHSWIHIGSKQAQTKVAAILSVRKIRCAGTARFTSTDTQPERPLPAWSRQCVCRSP